MFQNLKERAFLKWAIIKSRPRALDDWLADEHGAVFGLASSVHNDPGKAKMNLEISLPAALPTSSLLYKLLLHFPWYPEHIINCERLQWFFFIYKMCLNG